MLAALRICSAETLCISVFKIAARFKNLPDWAFVFRVWQECGSISTQQAVEKPAASIPKSSPPPPEKRLTAERETGTVVVPRSLAGPDSATPLENVDVLTVFFCNAEA
jgi:hypothetical protein